MSVSQAVRNPLSYLGRKLRMYRALLFDPGEFYDDLGSSGLRTEVLVVLVVGAIGIVGPVYAARVLLDAFGSGDITGGLSSTVTSQLWGNAVSPLLGALLLWIGFTVVLYLVSWLYSAAGGLFSIAKATAWALVPMALANLALTVAFAVTTYGFDTDDPPTLPSTATTTEQVAAIWGQIAEETLVVGAVAVGAVVVLWTGYISAHGVADARDLTSAEGYRVAAVPTVGYAAYVVLSIAGFL